ncbi:hypothetical protein PC113_g311 [Phytophthora cactorum]|nr:hypothetical protein PC113_g311 [Phytophthora cactorum]
MIREHFFKRLRLYVQIAFGGFGSDRTKKEKKEKADLVKVIMHAYYSIDETDVAEALQMRDVLTPDGVERSEPGIGQYNIKLDCKTFLPLEPESLDLTRYQRFLNVDHTR